MQTLLQDYRPFFELAAVASFFGWGTSLALGLGLCDADRALARGIFGIMIGGLCFDRLDIYSGLVFEGYPVAAGFAGTFLVVLAEEALKRAQEEMASRRPALAPASRRYRILLADPFSREVSPFRWRPAHRSWTRRAARSIAARAR